MHRPLGGWRAVSLPQALGGQPRLTPEGQLCRAAFLRIASAEAWSFELASDRRFETSSSTSSSVAFSCSSR